MNVNQVFTPHSAGTKAKAAAKAVSGSMFSQALAQCQAKERESLRGEDISSVKDFCDKLFLPDWLERLEELDRFQEEEKTLEVLYSYVDALVEQAKEENRAKAREEQLEFWLKRSI